MSRWSASSVVTTATVGRRVRNERSYSSASTTKSIFAFPGTPQKPWGESKVMPGNASTICIAPAGGVSGIVTKSESNLAWAAKFRHPTLLARAAAATAAVEG